MAKGTPKGNKGLKSFLIILISLVVAGAAALVIVPQFINWDKVKAQAEEKLTGITNHQVTIESIRFNLFKGIELKGLTIANGKGFSKAPLLSDEAAVVKYRLLPLIIGKVVIKAVVLHKPHVLVEKHAQGHFNFSDMIKKKPATAEKPVSEPKEDKKPEQAGKKEPVKLPFDILVSHIGIEDAKLIYRDLGSKQEYKLEAFNFKIDNLTLAGLTPINVLLTTNIHAMGKTIPLKFKTDWRFNYAKQQVLLDAVLFNIPGITFNANGTLDQVLSDPNVDIKGDVQLGFKTMLNELVPDEVKKKLPSDFDISGPVKVAFQAKGPAKAIDQLAVNFEDRLDLSVKAAGLAVPVGLEGTINLADNQVKLKQQLTLPGVKTELSGTVKQVRQDPLLALVMTNRLVLADLWQNALPAEMKQKMPPVKLDGQINVKSKVAGNVKNPKALSLAGDITVKNISIQADGQSLLKALNGTVEISPTKVTIKSLKADLTGEPLVFNMAAKGFDLRDPATLKPDRLKAAVNWSLESKKLNLGALMALMPKKEKAKGKTAADKKAEENQQAKPALPEPDAKAMMPAGLTMDGRADLGGVVFGQVKLGAINFRTVLKERLFTTDLKLDGYKGTVKNNTGLDFRKKLLHFNVDSSVNQVDLEPLLNDVVDTFVAAKLKKPELIEELKDKLTGRLTGVVKINGQGMRGATVKTTLKGSGDVKLSGSRLRKFAFQEKLAGWTGYDKFNQDIPFDRVLIKFAIANEVVEVTKFIAESGPKGLSGDIRMTAKGDLTFKAEYKKFRIYPRINPRAAKNISPEFRKYTEVLKDENGWVNLPMILNGPLKKPDVKPDWAWIKKQFAGYAKKKVEKATGAVKKKARDFINKQQGKSADEVQKNLNKELDKAKDKLKNLDLNNLFK